MPYSNRVSTWADPTPRADNLENLYADIERLVHGYATEQILEVMAEALDNEAQRYLKRTGDEAGAAQITATSNYLYAANDNEGA